MQLRNIRPFSQYQPGDTAEVPDGAEFDPFHWEAVEAQSEAAPVADAAAAAMGSAMTRVAADIKAAQPAVAAAVASLLTPKEM